MTIPDHQLRTLFRRTGILRARELEAAGLTRTALSRRVIAGSLIRVGRGLYALPDYKPSAHAALVAVAKRVPNAVFCLLTALRFHELTTQAPFEVWIAIGNKAHPPHLDYPLLRIMRFSEASLKAGVETHKIDGVRINVTNVAKTVVDCFKFRNKIGLDVALEALREAHRARKITAEEVWRYAKLNRVTHVMRPYLEAIA